MLTQLSTLSSQLLRDLAGEVLLGAREATLRKLLGDGLAVQVFPVIAAMLKRGWSPALLSEALTGMAATAERRPNLDELVELVVTNPLDSESPARDTRAVMLSLFEQAESDLMIVGYALHKSNSLLQPLAGKMRDHPELTVRLFLDLHKPPEWSKERLDDCIGRFSVEFREKYWPWEPVPEVWLDTRKWHEPGNEGHSLHAKCIIADRSQAFITSANLTEAAQYRNIETGVLIRDATIARRLADFFEEVCNTEFVCLI